MAKKVKVKMLVSISGGPQPEFGLEGEWNFQPGEIIALDLRKATVMQSVGQCVILTPEEARTAETATVNVATAETPEEPFNLALERMRLRRPA